jgi:DNA polymerase III alpha subunit (gram-positive type)
MNRRVRMPANIFWFDLETSGLDPSTAQPVQVACIITDINMVELRRMEVFVKPVPGCSWDAQAEEVHGFTREFLEEKGKSWEDALSDIIEFEGNCGMKPIPGGHNVTFDINFFRVWIPRGIFSQMFSYHIFDTMGTAQTVNRLYIREGRVPKFPRWRLVDVCKVLGIKINGAHNALADIEATVEAQRRMEFLVQLAPE